MFKFHVFKFGFVYADPSPCLSPRTGRGDELNLSNRLSPNISPEMHAFEMDLVHPIVRALPRLGVVVAQRGDAQDAAARSHELAVLHSFRGNELAGDFVDLVASAADDDDFQAVVLIEMNVQAGIDEIKLNENVLNVSI